MAAINELLDFLTDPQKSYAFTFIPVGKFAALFGRIDGQVKSMQIPDRKVAVHTVHRLNRKFQFAGRDESSNQFTVTFWDDEAHTIYRYLNKWYGLMNHDKHYGYQAKKEHYVSDLVVVMETGKRVPTAGVLFKNAFPVEISPIELNYESSNAQTITATFAFDFREDI